MDVRSIPMHFECDGSNMYGILSLPPAQARRAVVVIVGGPQYRVGSHRQFLLLSRFLASSGVPTLRFDHRGTGDSDGETTFEEMGPDIRAAIDALLAEHAEIEEIVIWGLCDAASAAMMYAPTDSRVRGLVLLNPWVSDNRSLARAQLKQAVVSDFVNFEKWKRLLVGKIKVTIALGSFTELLVEAIRGSGASEQERDSSLRRSEELSYQDRMLHGLSVFDGQVLLVLSGNDITAKEFDSLSSSNSSWRDCLGRPSVTIKRLPDSTHTFSRRVWRDQVAHWTLEWQRQW